MGDFLNSLVRGARSVYETPELAAALYADAVVAVLVTTKLRRRD